MKTNYSYFISTLLLIGICAFGIKGGETSEKDFKPNLEGTWKLISFKYGKDQEFTKVPPFMQYRKMLTKAHFTWVSYGENGDDVIGAGGGTYKIKGNKYIETSEFFHPHRPDIIGSATTFDFSLDGNYWKISGVIKSVKIDPKTGKSTEIEETKLSEVWERIN
ncbi:MAG: hypothetical protein ACPGJS_04305 [Flammeovirgaceae bacterium]